MNIGLGKEEYNDKIREAKKAAIAALEEALVDDASGRSNLGELGGVYSDLVDVC